MITGRGGGMITVLKTWFIPFFVLIWFAIMMAYSNRNRRKALDNLLEQEIKANAARRKDIDPAFFFTPDMNALPPFAPGDKQAEKAAAFASNTMLRLPYAMTNTELKLAYGPGQLENIAQYEENYQYFIRLLIEWAEGLIEKDNKKDALRILEYTIDMGSEYRKSYILAADLYTDDEKINELREKVENQPFKDEQVKNSILKYINREN